MSFDIDSEVERLNYFILAGEKNQSCSVSIFNGNKDVIYKFNSNINLIDENDFEVAILNSNVDKSLIKHNCLIKIEYEDNGVKTETECFLRGLYGQNNNIVLNISYPYKMFRYQKRNTFRVVMSPQKSYVSLDKSKEFLSNLPVINISTGGVAVLINAPEDQIKENFIFDMAEIELPLKLNNFFSTKMKICHMEKINREDFEEYIIGQPNNGSYFQVGIKFMSMTSRFEQSLIMVVNQIARGM